MFVPWRPRYTEEEARTAIESSTSWAEVLEALGYGYFGKNIKTVRNWAAKWDIRVDHLPNSPRRNVRHRHSAADIEGAIAASRSCAEALRRLGYCDTGGNWKTLKQRVAELEISTEHFDPYAASREALRSEAVPRLARKVDWAHPRPRQWSPQRQPDRELAHPLSQLRRHARHPLRQEESRDRRRTRLSPLREVLRAQLSGPAVLLPGLWDSVGPQAGPL